MNYAIIVAPLSGAVIGYITNYFAIKMLFRPRKAYYIGKRRVPFTPGLIPKEKARLAAAIGKTVADELLDPRTLSDALLSDEMLEKFGAALDRLYEKGRSNDDTLLAIAESSFGSETVNGALTNAERDVGDWLFDRLVQADLPERASDAVDEYFRRQKSSLAGMLTGLFISGDQLRERVSDVVSDYINENGRLLVGELLVKEKNKLTDMKLSELLAKFDGHKDKARRYALDLYRNAVTDYLGRALSALDLSQIITDKINSFDNEKLEQLILGVMKKELNAITWLGALLGGIMGFVNMIT